MVGDASGVGIFCDGGVIGIVQVLRSVKRNAAPAKGVCSYRQMGQGDGLIAKWIGAQV